MAKIITFSRTFPAYHPKAGQQTYFVEAILTQLGINYESPDYFIWLVENNRDITERFLHTFFDSLSVNIAPKSHTIRAHKRPIKVGEFINPKCWAGKPYNKTDEGFWQIKFAPDMEVKKIWKFEMDWNGIYSIGGKYTSEYEDEQLAKNDGLTDEDMQFWFMPNMDKPKPFIGQIICWNENVNY